LQQIESLIGLQLFTLHNAAAMLPCAKP